MPPGRPERFGGTLAWPDLPDDYKNRFFAALRDAPSIENYEISELLTMLSRDEPYRVVKLLKSRVEHMEDGAPARYAPLPHHWQGQLRFREHDAFPDILRTLCEWLAAAPGSMWRRYYGSQLFVLIAGGLRHARPRGNRRSPPRTRFRQDDGARRDLAPRPSVGSLGSGLRRTLPASRRSVRLRQPDAIRGALHYAVFAGGRWGVPGQPVAQGTEHRHIAAQLADQCLSGSIEEQFYRAVAASVETWAQRLTDDRDTPFDGRQW